MMRIQVEEKRGIKIFIIDNAYSEEEFCVNARDEWDLITAQIKSSNTVLFRIDEWDNEGFWLDSIRYWIKNKGVLHVLCFSEDLIAAMWLNPEHFGGEIHIYRSEKEAIQAIKSAS